MLYTIISMEDIFYNPCECRKSMPDPVCSLDLKKMEESTGDGILTDPYAILGKMHKDGLII